MAKLRQSDRHKIYPRKEIERKTIAPIRTMSLKRSILPKLTQNYVTQLSNRTLFSFTGSDTQKFLQSYITNDITGLDKKSMAALFLNVKGRVICDTIITNIESGNYLIECDTSVVDKLKSHILKFKLRQKFDIRESSYKVYAQLFPVNSNADLDGLSFVDPRDSNLGFRSYSETLGNVDDPKIYHITRILCGIAEGPIDVPLEDCFPLEINYDLLHGISWSKGCYLGQELTARTHHVGVVRSRLLPIQADQTIHGSQILKNGKAIGEIRSREGNVALAKLKLEEIMEGDLITDENIKVTPLLPSWYNL
jgi:folate-binding protein YgfZ